MKKTPISHTLLIILCLILPGCSVIQESGSQNLPQTLHCSVELPEGPKNVISYHVDFIELDPEQLKNVWLTGDDAEYHQWAEGDQWSIDDGAQIQYLNHHTGILRGGFSYFCSPSGGAYTPFIQDQSHKETELAVREMPDNASQYLGVYQMKKSELRDLSWKSQEEVKQEIQEKCGACGIDGLYLREIVLQDKDTLNYNRDIYNRSIEKIRDFYAEEEDNGDMYRTIEKTYEESDELYCLYYTQIVDGIPLTDKNWYQRPGADQTWPEIHFLYSAELGLNEADILCYYEVGDEWSEDPIISAQEALNSYVENYKKTIHFTDTEIIDIQLNYIVVNDSEDKIMKPAWVIYTKEESENRNELQDQPYYDYRAMAINAVTGVIIEGAMDLR